MTSRIRFRDGQWQRGAGLAVLEPAPGGAPWFTLIAEYDEAFIAALKMAVHATFRRWDRTAKVWLIRRQCHPTVLWLCKSYFSDVRDAVPPLPEDEAPPARQRGALARDGIVVPAHWRALYLLPSAPREVVAAVYRTLASQCHPDVGGNEELMRAINVAYETIKAERGW